MQGPIEKTRPALDHYLLKYKVVHEFPVERVESKCCYKSKINIYLFELLSYSERKVTNVHNSAWVFLDRKILQKTRQNKDYKDFDSCFP